MKVGDLVRCIWQPRVSKYIKGKGCISMKHTILGELGIIVHQRLEVDHHTILFLKFGYEHIFSSGAFEVISAAG
jgi:hypothetical protein